VTFDAELIQNTLYGSSWLERITIAVVCAARVGLSTVLGHRQHPAGIVSIAFRAAGIGLRPVHSVPERFKVRDIA